MATEACYNARTSGCTRHEAALAATIVLTTLGFARVALDYLDNLPARNEDINIVVSPPLRPRP